MQKILLAGALCLIVSGVSAQPWMTRFEGKERIRLQDVVDAHKTGPTTPEGEESEEEESRPPKGFVKEGKDHHFDRWRWYWEQHLDEQGYMVSPLKNFQEWEAYKKRQAGNNTQAKSTAITPNWSFQGPDRSPANGRGLGRIQKVTFHPTDSNTYWVGTAGGGVWKTLDNGLTWTCLTDMLPVLGAADISCNPLNPSVLYLCTGDRDANDNSSIGVLKSTDGGLTWNTTGFVFPVTSVARTNSLLVNPKDTSALMLTSSTGIYQSRDGAATWTRRATGSYRALFYMPGDTTIVYATSISNPQIYRSANGGATWAPVTSVSGASRVSIAVTPAAPNIVKAIFADLNSGLEGIYSSSDTGKTFTKIFTPISCAENYLANSPILSASSCGGQGWYDLTIAISPVNSNTVVIGGVNSWYSTNGGLSWQLANMWANYGLPVKVVHADKHFMGYHPLRPTVFFEGNDGGVFRTISLSAGWTDITNGMGITQFYRMSVANHSTSAIAGAQDNGSKLITPGAATQELTGGDGMNCELDPTNPSDFYTSIQYGSIFRNGQNISNNIPGQPDGAWITPYALHPRDGARIVAGYDRMYLSNDQGDNWTAVSPVFSSQKIHRVAFAMSNLNTMYAVVSNTIRRTNDLGVTWTPFTGMPGGTVSDIVVDHKDKQHFWITFSGYGSNKVSEYDTVRGWTSLNDTLPNIPVNCITIDTSNGTIYIGTDVAVFYRDTTMTDWAPWSTNLPAAEVTDMGINYTTGELWASTYGRGLWKSVKFDFPASTTGISVVPFAADVIKLSPNPSKGSFDIHTENPGLIGQEVTVSIFDISGRRIWSAPRSFSGNGTLHVDVSNLSPANYILDVAASNGMKAKTKLSVY